MAQAARAAREVRAARTEGTARRRAASASVGGAQAWGKTPLLLRASLAAARLAWVGVSSAPAPGGHLGDGCVASWLLVARNAGVRSGSHRVQHDRQPSPAAAPAPSPFFRSPSLIWQVLKVDKPHGNAAWLFQPELLLRW